MFRYRNIIKMCCAFVFMAKNVKDYTEWFERKYGVVGTGAIRRSRETIERGAFLDRIIEYRAWCAEDSARQDLARYNRDFE